MATASLRVLILLLGAAVLAACDGGMPRGAATHIQVGTQLAADQTLTRGLDSMPRTLDPSLLVDTAGQKVVDDLFEGLTAVGQDGHIVPGVASSWKVSPDGKTWTFQLRTAARWSDGTPVTAADFVYAWRREVDPKTGAEYSQALAPIVNAMRIATGKAPPGTLGVTAVDAHTLRVSLENPTPYLLDLLADSYMLPLPRATIERYGEAWIQPGHMVSNGPFVLSALVVGDRITLTKNPMYWDAASVHLRHVIYYPLDSATQLSRYLAGDLDYASRFSVSQLGWLRRHLGDQIQIGPYLGVEMLAFNTKEPPFAGNRDLRLAMTLALDRKILAEKLDHGVQKPAYSLIPPLPGYRQQLPAWASWSAAKRHAEARRLYSAAGYSAAHPLRVRLYYATSPSASDFFDALAAMWRTNLGADVQLYNEEFRVLQQDLVLHKAKLFWNSWIGDYPDPFTFMQLFQTGFQQNYGEYSNPRFDALLAAAAQQPDNALRYRDFEQAERILNQEAPYIPMLFYATEHLVKPYVKGVQPTLQDRSPSRYIYLLQHQGR